MMLLEGLDILVVEDHYFVATELSRFLRQLGADVIGPVARLPLDERLAGKPIDLALLDVKLASGNTLSLADEFARRGIPVAFITGYPGDALPPAYHSLLCLEKPVESRKLTAAVLRLTGRSEGVAE